MITMSRRRFAAGASALSLLGAKSARAQEAYPQRPVKLIVPYAPGGGTDVFSRLLATQIEREFGQSLIIDNRAGGASVIGNRAVADAPIVAKLQLISASAVKDPAFAKSSWSAAFGRSVPHDRRIPRPCRPQNRMVDQDHRCGRHQAGAGGSIALPPTRLSSSAKSDDPVRCKLKSH